MKKQKLSLEKFSIIRLTNLSSIFGGTITDTTTSTDDPTDSTFPTRSGCLPPPSIDPNDPFGECGG